MPSNTAKKILVCVLDNLGDAVMGSALIPALRKAAPGAGIGLWIKEYAAGVFDLDAEGIKVHAADPFWDKAPGRGKGRWDSFRRVVREIRRERYDTAFVLNADWRKALSCRLAGIPLRFGRGAPKTSLLLTRAVPADADRGHVVEDHAALFEAWAGRPPAPEDLVPVIGLSAAQKKAGADFRAGAGWGDSPIVVLHPITGDPMKNWPLDRWTRLAAELTGDPRRPRFVVLSSPREAPALRAAFAASPDGAVRVEEGTLAEIKPLLAEAAVFAGGDSGPGHMAAALGRPVVSLFGPTDPGRYRPLGPAVKVLRVDPIKDLPVEAVAAEVRAFLRR